MKKRVLGFILSAAMVICLCAGCGADNAPEEKAAKTETTGETKQDDAEEEAGDDNILDDVVVDTSRITVKPAENTSGEEIRIAALCVPYGPFWLEVVNGMESAKKLLADYNCTVDLIPLESLDGQLFYDAIQTCIVKEYDVISTFGVSDSICPIVDEATDAGIAVYYYNSDTAQECSRVAFIGQDLYAAGQKAADLMADILVGKGTVGIITGLFSVNAHELRRTGSEDQFKEKYPDIKLLETVECSDNDQVAYNVATDLLTGNPDLSGIICTANGQIGTAQAIEDLGLEGKVKIVCYDYMDEVIEFLRKGTINAPISQGPFDQGANPIVYGYNQVITGKPEVTGNVFTALDVITPENVNEYFPE